MPRKFAAESSRDPLDLCAQTRDKMLAFLAKLVATGIAVRVLDTARSEAEQSRLYEIGRSTPGKKVTNAKPDDTYHTKRRAFDLALLRPDLALDWAWMDGPQAKARWEKLGAMAEECGLSWGGRWRNRDLPHLEDKWCEKCQKDHKAKEFNEDGDCRVEPFVANPPDEEV